VQVDRDFYAKTRPWLIANTFKFKTGSEESK